MTSSASGRTVPRTALVVLAADEEVPTLADILPTGYEVAQRFGADVVINDGREFMAAYDTFAKASDTGALKVVLTRA